LTSCTLFDVPILHKQGRVKVAGVKVYPWQTWNSRSHAASECIGLRCHSI